MRHILIGLVGVVLLGALGLWWFSPSEVVKRRTQKLLEVLTFELSSGKGARQLGVYSLNAILAEELKLTAESIPEANGSFQRAELEAAYTWLGAQAIQTFFKLEEIQSVKVERDLATVHFKLNALVELPTYRPVDGPFQVVFKWGKMDSGWQLREAKWDKPVK